MSKKLITACLGVLALAAFALPANALAVSATLTHPTGTALAPKFDEAGKSKNCAEGGTCLTGTNIGAIIFKNDAGTSTLFECTSAVLTGALTKNSGGHIEGDITTATFAGNGTEFNGMKECPSGLIGPFTPTTNGTHAKFTGGAKEKVDGEDVENGTPWCVTAGGELPANTFSVRGGTCSEAARPITFVLDATGAGECKYTRSTAITGTYTTDTSGDAIATISPNATSTFAKEAGGVLCQSAFTFSMQFTLETDTSPASPVWIS